MRRAFTYIAMLALVWIAASSSGQAQSKKSDEFPNAHPKAGEMAPDFTLTTADGETFTLSEVVAKQPVVIEFGSYT